MANIASLAVYSGGKEDIVRKQRGTESCKLDVYFDIAEATWDIRPHQRRRHSQLARPQSDGTGPPPGDAIRLKTDELLYNYSNINS